MKLGVLMDPLSDIVVAKDSTVAMIKAASQLGMECYYFTLPDLFCKDGHAFADVSSIQIDENHVPWAKTACYGVVPLSTFDVILMRKDPPFNMAYIYATYALELAEREGVLVSNKPASLRDANEKFFTLQFPSCCGPTLVSQNVEQLRLFWSEYKHVVFKPLSAMGGRSIFYVDEKGQNLTVILDTLTQNQTIAIMAQRYIPDIHTTGDKRILMVDGKPVPYALARIPKEGEFRGNLAAGGHGHVVPLEKRDYEIAECLGPVFRQKGLSFVGIDVIGDYLTEINVTSPTCIREISHATGMDIAGDYIRALQKQLG